MHEEEHDDRGFDGGDEQRNHGVEGTEVHEGGADRCSRPDKQADANGQVKSLRVSSVFFVFRHIKVLSSQFSAVSSQSKPPSGMPANQIQQRKQINPDDIDQMPVQSRVFYRREVARRIMPLPCQDRQHAKQTAANDHVQSVHAGHRKIKREKQLSFLRVHRDLLAVVVKGVGELEGGAGYVVLLEFFVVLETLDHQEGHAEQYGNDEVADKNFAAACLCCFHRQHNRNRTHDQHRGDKGSHLDAELLASGGEGVEVVEAVNEVGAEHAAEEHDFRHQEQPHAQRGGVLLLLSVGEVVEQRRIVSLVCHRRNFGRRLACRSAGNRLAILQREPPVPSVESRRSYRLPR